MKKLVLIFLLVGILIALDWRLFITSKVPLVNNHLVVRQGDTYGSLKADLLAGNQSYFADGFYRLYVGFFGATVKPGVKSFPELSTFADVFASLDDNPEPIKVRLPEGATADEFADILSEQGIGTLSSLSDCFHQCTVEKYRAYFSSMAGYEGFLFPDTYLFDPDGAVKDVLTTILGNFSRRFQPLAEKYPAVLSEKGLRTIVIIASLLEREGRTLAEKRMVAGILYRRLQLDIRLDVDATVLYVKKNWNSTITAQDLLNNSPYNTRKYKGLPPGPICNPSLESIEAALSPTTSNYLYYLTGRDGEMHYATTLEGHVQNKWKFL